MSFIGLNLSAQKLTAADNSYRVDGCEIFLLQYLLLNWDIAARDKIALLTSLQLRFPPQPVKVKGCSKTDVENSFYCYVLVEERMSQQMRVLVTALPQLLSVTICLSNGLKDTAYFWGA